MSDPDPLRDPGPAQQPGLRSRARPAAWLARAAAEAAGRAALGGAFLGAAVLKLATWHLAVREAAQQGLPAAAPALALVTAAEALGGLGVLLGFETMAAALVLAGLLALGAPVFSAAGPVPLGVRLALFGALAAVAGRGAGPWSLDAGRRRQHRAG